MPTQRRPPMPKLPPLALGRQNSKRKLPYYLLISFAIFALPLFALHVGLLGLPLFWDELGQFIPTALDLFRDGSLISHSVVPNVHPPGLEGRAEVARRRPDHLRLAHAGGRRGRAQAPARHQALARLRLSARAASVLGRNLRLGVPQAGDPQLVMPDRAGVVS